MTTVATLTPPDLRLAPGAEARCTVTVHNRGEIVEGYHLEVLGDAAGWATVNPPQVQVYPGTEATAEITFRIPRGARVYAMDVPFAVRVLPMERPEHVAVPEGVLRVGELAELAGELLPQTSRTRRATVHDLAVDNLGNAPTVVEFTVSDPDNALKLTPRPARLAIDPGHAAVARIGVRHRTLLWRGQPVARRFRVTAATPDGPGVAMDGTSVQQPVLGRWLIAAMALLLVLALLGAGLWFGLLRPAVKSEAQKAGREAGKEAVPASVANAGPAEPAGGASPSAGTNGAANAGASANPSGSGKPMTTQPISFRTPVTDSPGGTYTQVVMRAGSANRFTISYIHIMAPQGDTGVVQILIGDDAWQVHQLANIRDLDLHPTPPLEVPANKPIRVRVECSAVGSLPVAGNSGKCYVNIVISGTEYKPAT